MRRVFARRAPVEQAAMFAAGALCSAAVLGAGGAYADPATALPSADELNKQVSVIFDGTASSAQRASYLEGGNAALPVANSIGGPIAEHRSMVSLQVENPTLEGDHVTAQLVMSVKGMGSQRRAMNWVERDGTWKLSNGSLCSLFDETSHDNRCPL